MANIENKYLAFGFRSGWRPFDQALRASSNRCPARLYSASSIIGVTALRLLPGSNSVMGIELAVRAEKAVREPGGDFLCNYSG